MLAAFVLAAALCIAFVQAARAQDQVILDQGGDVLDLNAGGNMSATNARVAPILKSYPDQYAVVCVAGCIGKPHVVQLLPKPVAARAGEYVPTNAKIGDEVYGPTRPAETLAQNDKNDVVCIAGCVGKPGQVLQRINDLPPPAKPKAKKKSSDPLNWLP